MVKADIYLDKSQITSGWTSIHHERDCRFIDRSNTRSLRLHKPITG